VAWADELMTRIHFMFYRTIYGEMLDGTADQA
jgi:hypothetical protein